MQDNLMEESIECPICQSNIFRNSLFAHVGDFHGFISYNKILKLMIEIQTNLYKNIDDLKALNELFLINQKFNVLPNEKELTKYKEIKDNVSKFLNN